MPAMDRNPLVTSTEEDQASVPGFVAFWPWPVSIFGHLFFTVFIADSPMFIFPSKPGSLPP